MQLYTPCPKKYTPRLLAVICCNLSILLIKPTEYSIDYPYAVINDHQQLSLLSDSAAKSESWLFLPVISPPQKLL